MNDNIYWIWLSLAATAGSETFKKLISVFGAPKLIYEADDEAISGVVGKRSRDLAALCDKDLTRAQQIFDFCESKNVGILTYEDAEFPKSLREIDTPPVLLYYRGILPDFNNACIVSMVGTRRLTGYGRKNAFSIGYDLAKAGAVIASGMAIGIDGVSHAGSLAAGGVNIAFLGSGIDVCYPEIHQTLARAIVKNGCVMTEYAPGTRPEGRNFPIRNRLIAGISYCAVVIEGNSKSGSLITARYAKEQGKPVYALPGNVDNKTSEVTNLLIKNGAKLITSAMDIISDVEFVFTGKINPFNVTERLDISLDEALSEYKVSAIIPDDKIFSRMFKRGERKTADKADKKDKNRETEETKVIQPVSKEPDDIKFDKDTIAIYKMIPLDGEILIDDLASGEYGMQSVMKALLKLEMGRFVVMLPGEKVKRNL